MAKRNLFPKAGRELDALIAEKVMGWRWFECVGVAVLCPPYLVDSWLEHSVLQKPIDSPDGRFREHVDGVKFFDSSHRSNGGRTKPEFPLYSTDVAAAVSVFEHHFTEWQVGRLANGLYTATGCRLK